MSPADIIKDLYRHDLNAFTGFAFRELNPHTPYQDNWDIAATAHVLQQVAQGKIKRLIITKPPRTLKSHSVSVALVAWMLARDPRKKILCLHGGNALGASLHEQCAALMQTPRFCGLFPYMRITEQNNRLITGHGGQRMYLNINTRLTGLGADTIIIDDPLSPMEAQDPAERERINTLFDQNIRQRLNSKKDGAIIVVMQRLHEDDLVGHLLKKDEGWVHLNFPAIAMHDETWPLPYDRTYHRKKGECLHPARESRQELLETLDAIGGYTFAYQYMQGAYVPRFGEADKGAIWVTPYRVGEFWDERLVPEDVEYFKGYMQVQESDLIRSRVFGIDAGIPDPDTIRHRLTREEYEIYVDVINKRYGPGREAWEAEMRELGKGKTF